MTNNPFDPRQFEDRTKFVLALLVVLLASGLLLGSKLTGDQWVAVTTWTVAAYMAGQVTAVVAQGFAVSRTPSPPPVS